MNLFENFTQELFEKRAVNYKMGAKSKINKEEEENFKQEKLEGDLTFTLSIFFTDSD